MERPPKCLHTHTHILFVAASWRESSFSVWWSIWAKSQHFSSFGCWPSSSGRTDLLIGHPGCRDTCPSWDSWECSSFFFSSVTLRHPILSCTYLSNYVYWQRITIIYPSSANLGWWVRWRFDHSWQTAESALGLGAAAGQDEMRVCHTWRDDSDGPSTVTEFEVSITGACKL